MKTHAEYLFKMLDKLAAVENAVNINNKTKFLNFKFTISSADSQIENDVFSTRIAIVVYEKEIAEENCIVYQFLHMDEPIVYTRFTEHYKLREYVPVLENILRNYVCTLKDKPLNIITI